MRPMFFTTISVGALLWLSSTAQATVGCEVVSTDAEAEYANLYQSPDPSAEILRQIPLGDIVFYPNDFLAPQQVDGWVWVRHDITQLDIWQSGIFGWMLEDTLATCG